MNRIDREINRTDVVRQLCIRKNFLPVGSTVGRAIDTAHRIRVVYMSERSDIDSVGVFRIDDDATNLPRIFEADGFPCLACIRGFEDADAIGVLAANIRLARTDVDNVGVGGRNRDGSDGADGYALIADGEPGASCIVGLPYSTANRAHVESVWLTGASGDSVASATAHRTDVAPLQATEHLDGILGHGHGFLR